MKTPQSNYPFPREAIVTKYLPATNSRGARIKVKILSLNRLKSFPYPYHLNGVDCHSWAVDKFLGESDTVAAFVVGTMPSNDGYLFVRA